MVSGRARKNFQLSGSLKASDSQQSSTVRITRSQSVLMFIRRKLSMRPVSGMDGLTMHADGTMARVLKFGISTADSVDNSDSNFYFLRDFS